MSLIQRDISVTFQLASGNGTFAESGTDTVTVTGLRIRCIIVKAGGASMGGCQLRIYGMTQSLMNQLSTLGKPRFSLQKNIMKVSAGDADTGMTLRFQGTVTEAWADYRSAPDVPFNVIGFAGAYEAIQSAPPLSYPGPADAATIMATIATTMGLAFENDGVTVKFANPYFPGSPRAMAQACADAGRFNWTIDNGTLAIWPSGQARGAEVPLVGPDTGMVSYPTYTASGIAVESVFNPSIGYGQNVKVQSSLPAACGTWTVYYLQDDLASQAPDGPWFTRFEAAPIGFAPVR